MILGILKKITKKDIFINLMLIVLLVAFKSVVLGNYSIPTGSMNPTIIEGDKKFSNNLSYSLRIPFTKHHIIRWAFPERGDIIVFIYPHDNKTPYTKRVIGIPGDRIHIKGKRIVINGQEIKTILTENRLNSIIYEEHLYSKKHLTQHINLLNNSDIFKEITVPKDSLFVMGDNRDNSFDSRSWGFVPIRNVTGKLVFRWLSIDPESYQIKPGRIGFLDNN